MAGRARWAFGTLLQMGDGGEEPVAGGGSTTLSAAVAAGATSIQVGSSANFAVNDRILIGGAGGEQAVISAIAGAAAPYTITLTDALEDGWASGSTVVEVAAETFTTIAEVKDIDGPEVSLDTEDVTPHDAVGGWEEIIPTILRSGEVTFDLNFVPSLATHGDFSGGLMGKAKSRDLTNFKLILPTQPAYGWAYAAYVTRMGHAYPVGGAMNAGVTLKITGQPVLAAA